VAGVGGLGFGGLGVGDVGSNKNIADNNFQNRSIDLLLFSDFEPRPPNVSHLDILHCLHGRNLDIVRPPGVD